MVVRFVAAALMVTACACASGGSGDSAVDDGGPGAGDVDGMGDAGNPLEGSAVRAEAGNDSGGGIPADATSDDGAAPVEASRGDDSGVAPGDSGGPPDTGSPQPDAGSVGDICPSNAQYAWEAAVAAASGNIILCLSGVCAAGQCCYEQLNPGDVCVAK